MPSLGYIQKGPKVIPNEGNNGGGGGTVLPVICIYENGGIDMSFNELKSAVEQGKNVYMHDPSSYEISYVSLLEIGGDPGEYMANFGGTMFMSSDPDENMAFSD